MGGKKWFRFIAMLLAFGLVAAACGSSADEVDTSTEETEGDESETEESAEEGETEEAEAEASEGEASAEEESEAPSGEMADVTLTLQWVTQAQFAGYYAGLENGYYEEEGINLTIQPGGPDVNNLQLLISGDTDIAIQQFGRMLASRDQGAELVSMGAVFERGGYRLAYFESAGIEGIEDFEGKTIGLWNGFMPQASATFGKLELDIESDAEVFNQGFDMVAFLDGTLDLASAMTYNEYAQALAGNQTDDEILLFNPNDEGTATLEDNMVTTEAWLADNPELAEGFVRATARGWIFCRDNPEECIDIVLANGTALPLDFQTWQMNEINQLMWPSTNGVLNLTDDMFQQSADILFEYGVIENEASPDAYDTSARDAAVATLTDEDLFGADYAPLELDPKELFGG